MALRVTWKSQETSRSLRSHGAGVPMDAQEDILEDVVRVRLTIHAARDEGPQAVTKLRPDLLGVASLCLADMAPSRHSSPLRRSPTGTRSSRRPPRRSRTPSPTARSTRPARLGGQQLAASASQSRLAGEEARQVLRHGCTGAGAIAAPRHHRPRAGSHRRSSRSAPPCAPDPARPTPGSRWRHRSRRPRRTRRSCSPAARARCPVPLTRIVGELTKPSARACSAEATSVLRTDTSAPAASRTRPTSARAASRLASVPRQRVHVSRSRYKKSMTT